MFLNVHGLGPTRMAEEPHEHLIDIWEATGWDYQERPFGPFFPTGAFYYLMAVCGLIFDMKKVSLMPYTEVWVFVVGNQALVVSNAPYHQRVYIAEWPLVDQNGEAYPVHDA
jgi:hypothetical protein